MPKIVQGFVQDVLVKTGSGGNSYAVVGIGVTEKTRSGFDETTVMEFMVAGNDFKNGMHAAYQARKGAEVFAPYGDEVDMYNGKARIRYSLKGAPLRLQEQAPAQAASAPLKQA